MGGCWQTGSPVDRRALERLGVSEGDTVATFAWNSASHLEWFFGVPMAGAILTPVNVRFSAEQIDWVVAHAQARVIAVGASLTGRLAGLLPRLGSVRHFVVLADGGEVAPEFSVAVDYVNYECLLNESVPVDVPDIAEDRVACAFYTSGTSGRPEAESFICTVLLVYASGLRRRCFRNP